MIIKHRTTGEVIFEGADLTGAKLMRADLVGADLRWAKLTRADLERADLTEAYLEGAELTGADLEGADLEGADLTEAHLEGADLTRANLTEAYLAGAYLAGADLTGANLIGAELTYEQLISSNTSSIKEDFFNILAASPDEVNYLRAALVEGKVNGTAYEGECACLVGTIANAKGVNYRILSPNVDRPAETWFLAIRKGDMPDNNPVSRLTVEWVDEFLNKNKGN